MAVDDARYASQPRSAAELRKLWDAGQRGPALRGVLVHWDELLARGDELHWLEKALRASGLPAEAFAVKAEATRRAATEQGWEPLIRSVLLSGDAWWARELLNEAGRESRPIRALAIETELALGEDPGASIAAWQRQYRDEPALEAAMGWWVRCGRIEEAERLLADTAGLTMWRARIALWRRQPHAALELLAQLPGSPEADCLAAIAAVLEGRLAEAESQFRELLESAAAPEAWSWLSTVLRKQGRYAEAMRAADAASIARPTFVLATRLERELAEDYERAGAPDRSRRSTMARLLRATGWGRRSKLRRIRDLEHAAVLYPLGAKPHDSIATLEDVLERLAGNHTANITTCDAGRLASYVLPVDPRHFGASIQRVLWTRGADAARGLFRQLASRVDRHPLYLIYQGELELWLGAYEEAARLFRDAIDRDPTTRWAWIGLGASAMLQGGLSEAQAIWAKGLALTRFAGPTLYVYRGECYRRQGKTLRAREDLDVALREKPNRLSARINRALLDGDPEAMERVRQDCRTLAPLLFEDLHGGTAEQLEQVLAAMRGNRSSSDSHVCYHLWDRVWQRAT